MKRKGANRTVLLVGPWALKFPTLNSWRDFLFGLLNNQTEARVGRSGHPFACPVLWAIPGGWLVVMPRLPIMTAAGFAATNMAQVIGEGNLCVECKPCSFGLYGGRIVAVDYGWDN